MGGFYALPRAPIGACLGELRVLPAFGALAMAPMLIRLLDGHEKQMGQLMPIAEVPAIIGMLLFLTNMALSWRQAPA